MFASSCLSWMCLLSILSNCVNIKRIEKRFGAGRNTVRLFNCSIVSICVAHLMCFLAKRPNLKLKTCLEVLSDSFLQVLSLSLSHSLTHSVCACVLCMCVLNIVILDTFYSDMKEAHGIKLFSPHHWGSSDNTSYFLRNLWMSPIS